MDEIGKLSQAFNEMAAAIHKEDEAQKTFLATVSHELRTPISYVKGYSEAIQSGMIKKEEQDETIGLLVREANRMERLTNELLQLARMTNEQEEEITVYPIPLAETLREVEQLLQPVATRKAITLEVTVDDTLIVIADEEKLKQITINLVENAVNYSSEGSRVVLRAQQQGRFARIIIQDQGIGIPAEDLPHITERFYRVNKARSRSDGGSGLGLSIVDQLVKQLHATMTINSEVGKGTTILVDIPLMEE